MKINGIWHMKTEAIWNIQNLFMENAIENEHRTVKIQTAASNLINMKCKNLSELPEHETKLKILHVKV